MRKISKANYGIEVVVQAMIRIGQQNISPDRNVNHFIAISALEEVTIKEYLRKDVGLWKILRWYKNPK